MNLARILDYVLLPLGILILALTGAAFFFPFGKRFSETPQKFKGFGVEVEFTALVVFFVVGVALTLGGVFWRISDLEKKVSDLSSAADEMKLVAETLQKVPRQVIPIVTLEGITGPGDMPKLSDVRASIYFGLDKRQDVEPVRGLGENQFRLIISDMTSEIVVDSLVLVDEASNRRWVYDQRFSPVVAKYALKRRGQ